MIMTPLKALTGQSSGALTSFLSRLRATLTPATPGARKGSAGNEDAFLSEVLQQSAPSSQEACARRNTIAQILHSADFTSKVSTADWLLLEGNYNGAIALYHRIAADHPEEIAFCQRCIGAAHHFLGNYEVAIEFYQRALASGEEADLIADDIGEARDAITARDQHRPVAA